MLKLKLKILFILVILGNIASAQDLIVTTKNDSIKCKIERDDFDFIYYSTQKDNQAISNKIKLSEVKNIRYKYFENTKVNQNIPLVVEDVYRPYRTYRLFIDGGLNLVTAKSLSTDDKELDKHLENLKLGYQYGAGVHIFGKRNFGYGLHYKHYFNQNKNDSYLYIDSIEGNTIGELSDKINIDFIGASFLHKTTFFNNKMNLLLGISGGYLHYKNNNVRRADLLITGNTFGMLYSMGVDFKYSNKLVFGADFNLLQATMRKYTYDINGTKVSRALDKDQYENISRIDLSVGFRYYLER